MDGKVYVYCLKSQLLRLADGVKIQVTKGSSIWMDEDVVAIFPKIFKPTKPAEDAPETSDENPPETPSDADGDTQTDPGNGDQGEGGKDDSEGSDETPDPDEKVDPLAEAMAEVADLADNKKALEAYGRKFGIELNRRKTLKNMKADLEAELKELMSGE